MIHDVIESGFSLGIDEGNGAMTKNVYPSQHVAIFTDGTTRRKKQRSFYRFLVYQAGGDTIKPVMRLPVEYRTTRLTFYVSHTENWKRARNKVI